MDEQVLAAMVRWPNVPDVYGWLSLSSRGIWHLHPDGRGWDATDPPGTPITNPRFTAFINRNYAPDDAGGWYFQNGPQRVYVRLDAAPWIVRTTRDAQGGVQLLTHAQSGYGPVQQWFTDEDGRLYGQAPQGAGLIDGRDMLEVADNLLPSADALRHCASCEIPRILHFIRKPVPR
jgi:hypothetical protein